MSAALVSASGVGLGLVGSAAGVLCLRRAWRHPGDGRLLAFGWGLLALSVLAWSLTAGADMALALALLIPSPVAYAVLASGAKVRRGKAKRPPRAEVELPQSGARWSRAALRAVCAGPLAAAAAVCCGAAMALKAPLSEPDRLIGGAFLAPLLWAVGMIWATTDPRLGRIGAGLGAVAALGLAAAAL